MRKINFDHLAASPLLPEVRETMLPYLGEEFGNPLSKHLYGETPKEALEKARTQVAELIHAEPEEIIFTSGGSEANNLAVKGAAHAGEKKGKHIIASPIEHHSVLHPLKRLEKQGYEISWLKADGKGRVDPEEVAKLVRKDTVLVTVIYASGEIGTVQPIAEIGSIARKNGIIFHTDAAAAAGMMPLDTEKLSADLLSLAGNVFYGPPGTGALYKRKGVKILPLIEGGIQESGLRAGTHNTAGIAGMGRAAEITRVSQGEWRNRVKELGGKLIKGVLGNIEDVFLTGDPVNRIPGHASFCVKFIEGESILLHLNFSGIAGTSGSTCSSESLKVSHVLEAIGIDPVWAQGSVVFTLGIDNTEEEVDYFVGELSQAVGKLRRMSPILNAEDVSKFKDPPHDHHGETEE